MQLKRLLKDLNIEKITGAMDVNIKGVSSHSRDIKEGYVFVALKGSMILFRKQLKEVQL
jgi:UDP-N-acetylmuramoyl-L-alanyl-D-glutamate--2,6-diaminopimelate ligase